MPEGETEVNVSPIVAKWNETRRPASEVPIPGSTDVTSLPRAADATTFRGQCACGVVLLALYIVLCNYWPEIPTAFLALVTAVGLSGFLDKKPVATVSSQTSSTTQTTDTQTERLHSNTNPESIRDERRLSSKVTRKDHQLFPHLPETECDKTNDVIQRDYQSLSELSQRERQTNDLYGGQREHQSCLEQAQRGDQTNDTGQREHQWFSDLAQGELQTNDPGWPRRRSSSELPNRERQSNDPGQREHQLFSELFLRKHEINDLGRRHHLLTSELNQEGRQTNDLGQTHRQSCSEPAQRERQWADQNQRHHLPHVRSELAQTDRTTNYLSQRDSLSCSELVHGEFGTRLSHHEPGVDSVELRLSEYKMDSGLIQTESEANVEDADVEYYKREIATQNEYTSQHYGGPTLSQGVQTDEDESTNYQGICGSTVRHAFVKTRDFSCSTMDDNEGPDLSEAEASLEESSLENPAIPETAGEAHLGTQATAHAFPAMDASPKEAEKGRYASALKKRSLNVKSTKKPSGQQSLSATKAKRSQIVAPRVRVSSAETVTDRPEIPAFGKVWREPEERARQPDYSHAHNSLENKSPADGDVAEDVTGKPEKSRDCSLVVTGNSFDQNLNCHNCCMYGHVPSDCLSETISAFSGEMHKGQITDSSALLFRNKSDLDSDGVSSAQVQRPRGGVSPVVGSCVSQGRPQTEEAHTQTVLFSDILRINIRRNLRTETRRFHAHRRRLRFKYARQLEKLRRDLLGKNQIVSSLQLQIPTLEQEIHGLRAENAEVTRALQEERGKTLTLMGRLKDVYDRLMVINSAQLLQQQHLQFDHTM